MVSHARELGIARIVGAYRPTERNRLVEDHYAKPGFTECECSTDGSTLWKLDPATYTDISLPMTVIRSPA